jgi:hypothetical protein
MQIDKAGARHAAQPVGQRLGLARGAGQAEALGHGQREDRGITACAIAVEIRLQHARRELPLRIGHCVADLRPDLFDCRGGDSFLHSTEITEMPGGRGRFDCCDLGDGAKFSLDLGCHQRLDAGRIGPRKDRGDRGEDIGDGRVFLPPDGPQRRHPRRQDHQKRQHHKARLAEEQRVHTRHSDRARTSWPGATRSGASATIRAPGGREPRRNTRVLSLWITSTAAGRVRSPWAVVSNAMTDQEPAHTFAQGR